MYASIDFATKKDFRLAVKRGEQVVAYSPELGVPAVNGREFVTGPWPMQTAFQAGLTAGVFGPQEKPRTTRIRGWKAHVTVKDMRVVQVH